MKRIVRGRGRGVNGKYIFGLCMLLEIVGKVGGAEIIFVAQKYFWRNGN
jgi:hypothetical protein